MPYGKTRPSPNYDRFLRRLRAHAKQKNAMTALANWLAAKYKLTPKSALVMLSRAVSGSQRLGAEYCLAVQEKIAALD